MLISKEKKEDGTKPMFKIQKEGNEIRIEEGGNLIVINGENVKYLFISSEQNKIVYIFHLQICNL